MQKEEIIKAVQVVFIDVFEDDDIILNYNTTANDIEDWDSLNNILLIVEIEKKFKLKFKLQEIYSFKNIGELCDYIFNKVS